MGIHTNPNIITTGLEFDMDVASLRSYVGPPIANMATEISPNYGDQSSATFKITNGTENVLIPSIGFVNSKYVDVYNDYNGGSGDCCPSLFRYASADVAATGSTLHTYAIVYKSVNGYTNGNYMYRYEFGTGYIFEGGLFNTSNRIHLGDDWYWAWATFTTNAATTRIISPSFFMYQYATFNRLYVAKVLLCQGDYSALHPNYWPEPNTTRSTSQVINDLTGVSTATATNMTYASNGAITFNGSTSRINVSTSLFNRVNGNQMTVACWIKPSRLSGVYQNLVVNRNDNQYNWMLYQHTTDGSIQLHGLNQNKSTYIPTVGTWIYVVNTVDPAGNSILYVNGVVQQTVTGFTYNLSSPSLLCIGSFGPSAIEPYLGSINAVQLYNRILSQDEIQQNFNAQRARYGV
jgi:hypothetical protein